MSPSNSRRSLLIVVVLGALIAACNGKESRIQSHLEKGQALLAQSDPDRALIEVRNVIQMDPKRPEAYYLAGQIEESRSELRKAFGNYSKALEMKPDFYDAKAGLARLQLAIGADPESQKIVDEILSKEPTNVQARILNAALMARKGDVEGAIRVATEAAPGGHVPVEVATVLAGLYASKRDFASAQTIVDKALVEHPKDLSLLSIGADLARRLHQDDRVVAFYERATSAAPKDYAIWRTWADFQDQSARYEAAESVLRQAIKASPDDSDRYLTLVRYIAKRRGEDAGLKELVSIGQERPRDYPIQFALASLDANAGNTQGATKILEAVIKNDGTGPAGLSARNQIAVLDLAGAHEAEASGRLEEILKINPRDSVALLQRGRLRLMHHQLDGAIADLRSAAKDKPDSPQILGLLVAAYRSNKQNELARDTLSDAAKLFPNHADIALLWTQFLIASGQSGEALGVLDSAIRNLPQNADLYVAKARLQEGAKDDRGAEQTLTSLIGARPGDPQSPMALGQLLRREKKYDQALIAFDEAATLAPDALEPKAAALETLVAQRRFVDAQKRVEAEIARAPGRAVNYQLQGTVYAAQGNAAAAESSYRKAIETESTAVSAYVNLANLLALQKRVDEVSPVLEAGLRANPRNVTLESAEADFLTKIGQYDRAIALYDLMLRENPANTVATNNLAYLLAEIKGDRESLERAIALTRAFEYVDEPGLLDTLGWTHYKLGQFADALPILQRAEALSPHSQLLELHYGMALFKNGEIVQGKEHLRDAAQGASKLPDEARKMIEQG